MTLANQTRKQLDMEGFLSIDISKEYLDFKISVGPTDDREPQRVQRSHKGLKKISKQLKSLGVTKLFVCMEATGSYWRVVAEFFFPLPQVQVYVVNPARIKAQRKTEQKRSKTDKIDTGVMMRFLKANILELPAWSPPSANVRALQDLVRCRDLLVGQRASLKTMLKSKTAIPLVVRVTKGQIKELDESITALEKEMKEVTAQDEVLRSQSKSAITVDGVGDIVSAVLISECRAFKEIKQPRQATAFAGLDVVTESSGNASKPPRISRQGSALLRKTFVLAAASAIRKQNVFKEFYSRLRDKGMKRKPALVATARKLLEVTVAIVLSGSSFQKMNTKAA
jgi:transposase